MNLHNYRKVRATELPSPQELDPPAIERLGEVAVPTCLIVGDKDVREMLSITQKLEQGIPGATKVVMHDVAHAPNMEQPEKFNQIVLDFLASV